MVSKKLKSDVRKALEEVRFDEWHEKIHREIMYKAQLNAEPSDKEQEVAIMCGVCDEVLRIRLPATFRDISPNPTNSGDTKR